jgi:uncharacterized protein (TIGR00299 family) protein
MLASRPPGVKGTPGPQLAESIMKIAYFDTGSGISGDMTVGALMDAARGGGVTVERLASALAALPVGGYRLTLDTVEVNGLRASSFGVHIDEKPHFHREWRVIRAMIEEAGGRGLGDGVVERAIRIFSVLAEAEAKIHGVAPDDVHFHEVGAIDSIVDVVGTAWCLDELGIEACFAGPLPSGSGYTNTEHGRLPVPAPATAELLAGFEVIAGDGEGELVTPTGAAILAALARPLRPTMTLQAIGTGAGTRRFDDRPNVLRVLLGEADPACDEQVMVIEADVDDMTPAALAHVADRLRDAGARDVSIVPSSMKKGRVGMRLTVLCDLGRLEDLARLVLSESTSIGLRYRAMSRVVLPRVIDVVDTDYGPIAVKVVVRPDGRSSAEPEFDDTSRAALARGVPIATVRAAALEAWSRKAGKS